MSSTQAVDTTTSALTPAALRPLRNSTQSEDCTPKKMPGFFASFRKSATFWISAALSEGSPGSSGNPLKSQTPWSL